MKFKTQNKNLEFHLIKVFNKRIWEIRMTLNNLRKDGDPLDMFNSKDVHKVDPKVNMRTWINTMDIKLAELR